MCIISRKTLRPVRRTGSTVSDGKPGMPCRSPVGTGLQAQRRCVRLHPSRRAAGITRQASPSFMRFGRLWNSNCTLSPGSWMCCSRLPLSRRKLPSARQGRSLRPSRRPFLTLIPSTCVAKQPLPAARRPLRSRPRYPAAIMAEAAIHRSQCAQRRRAAKGGSRFGLTVRWM